LLDADPEPFAHHRNAPFIGTQQTTFSLIHLQQQLCHKGFCCFWTMRKAFQMREVAGGGDGRG
jgi:hypothetical protein